jgi:hypothetical protein
MLCGGKDIGCCDHDNVLLIIVVIRLCLAVSCFCCESVPLSVLLPISKCVAVSYFSRVMFQLSVLPKNPLPCHIF